MHSGHASVRFGYRLGISERPLESPRSFLGQSGPELNEVRHEMLAGGLVQFIAYAVVRTRSESIERVGNDRAL